MLDVLSNSTMNLTCSIVGGWKRPFSQYLSWVVFWQNVCVLLMFFPYDYHHHLPNVSTRLPFVNAKKNRRAPIVFFFLKMVKPSFVFVVALRLMFDCSREDCRRRCCCFRYSKTRLLCWIDAFYWRFWKNVFHDPQWYDALNWLPVFYWCWGSMLTSLQQDYCCWRRFDWDHYHFYSTTEHCLNSRRFFLLHHHHCR